MKRVLALALLTLAPLTAFAEPPAIHFFEIVTPDVEATAAVYSAAFGFEFGEPVPLLGGAITATMPDGSLCSIRAPMHDQEKTVVRTYLRVDDLDAAVKRAADLGAEIAIERMEIPGYGVIAIYFMGGVEQGLWEVP